MSAETELGTRVPEPAVIRGVIVSIVALVAILTGKTLDISWVDPALVIYAAVAPVALSLWIRRHVTPVKKAE